MKKIFVLALAALVSNAAIINVVSAHCPLCTIGAGAAALGASWLGLSSFSVGIFIGAFGLAIGLWIGKLLQKKFHLPSYQIWIWGAVSFLTTDIPLRPMLFDNRAMYISLTGEFGTWLNRTYYLDLFIVGSVAGAAVLIVSPYLSRVLKQARNGKMFPYQGLGMTFALLLLLSLLFELFI